MPKSNRRTFLATTAKAAGLLLAEPAFATQTQKPRLSFSTLGCPKWTLDQILTCAVTNGYQGVELRGLQGELDLTRSPAFSSPERIRATRQQFAGRNVAIVNLGASTRLHLADPAKRTEQLDHAKRFIELATQLGCPYVRVFPNELPKNQDRAQTIERIVSGLVELSQFATGSPVQVLLETHGDVIESGLLNQIMTAAGRPNVGLVWDIVNMWSVTKEPPAHAYQVLKSHIRHVHTKDLRIAGDKHQYVALGEGDAPLAEAINALRNGGYAGYYCYEWEKVWHPEIPEPEEVFPKYPKAMQRYFS